MKLTVLIALLLVVLATSGLAQTQKSLDSTISDLQRHIQAREAIDHDKRTSADLRALNRRVLDDKRAELRLAVQTRIGQLQSYLRTLGPSATPEDRQSAETSLRRLLAISGGAPVSSSPAAAGNSTRPRVIGEPRTAPNVPVVISGNQTASPIRLDPVREGDTTIHGWSAPSVKEIVVEIRTREVRVQNSNGAVYSHTTQGKFQSALIAYRVFRLPSNASASDSWAFTVKLAWPLSAAQEIRAIPNGAPASATPWAQVSKPTNSVATNAPVAMPLPQAVLPASEQQRYNRAIQEVTDPSLAGYPPKPPVELNQCSMPGISRYYEVYLNWKGGGITPAQAKHSGPYCLKLRDANTMLYTYRFDVTEVGPAGSPLDILNDAITAIKNVPKSSPAAAAPPQNACEQLSVDVDNVKQAGTDLEEELASLLPAKSDGKAKSISLETTLAAWNRIPPKFDAFEAAVESLRQTLVAAGWNPNCKAIKDADDLILNYYRKARDAYLRLKALKLSSHVVAFFYEVDSGNDTKIDVSELYEGSPTEAATKTYRLTHGYTAITSSAGFMVTTLPARSYSSVTAPDPANPTTNQNVLGVDYGRGTRTALTALLNYNLPFASRNDFGLALSVGPVFDISNGKADTSRFGLFGGVGLRLSKWMYVTPGVHVGEFADFPQGYTRTGQVIPANSGTPAPVKRYTTRFAVAVTFKVKDLWTPAPAENNSGSK